MGPGSRGGRRVPLGDARPRGDRFAVVGRVRVRAGLAPSPFLSTGEAFRADLARLLADGGDPAVCDEFTSVVDRQVGKVCSYAVAKTVRRRGQRFVGVSCHEDVIPWLAPDWIYRTDTGVFTWGPFNDGQRSSSTLPRCLRKPGTISSTITI